MIKLLGDGDFWLAHLKKHNRPELVRINEYYPKERVLTVDLSKITDNKIWQKIHDFPKGQIEEIQGALLEYWTSKQKIKPEVRFINVTNKKQIRDLGHEDVKKLISISCLVKRVSVKLPKVIEAAYHCHDGHPNTVAAKHGKYSPPHTCSTQGCKSRFFILDDARCKRKNHQFIYVQELLEDLRGGIQPTTLKCEAVDELCNHVLSGDRVQLNGILYSVPRAKDAFTLETEDFLFEINSIERGDRDFEEISLSEDEEKQIVALSKEPDIFDRLTDSIAPSIMGMRIMKQAAVLLMFEGVSRVLDDGGTRRGYLNVLVVSDPGMAKTEILEFVNRVAIRSAFAVATTSTKVGLIAPVVRDEMTGQYAVEAGPYVLANGGVFCLDEAGELSKDDFKYLGECMEKGYCHISKGGLNVTVQTHASLFAACNPKDGVYDPYGKFSDQVKIPAQILSRFDLKLLFTDTKDEEHDLELARFIHKVSNGEKLCDGNHIIPPDLFRKYLFFAKKVCPTISDAASEVINTYYAKIRKASIGPDKIPVTARQINSIRHLTEGHARIRLSPVADVEDAEAVIALFDMTLWNINTGADGKLNMGLSERKTGDSLPSQIIKAIKEIGGETRKASEMSVISMLKKKGIDEDKIEKTIRALLREGKLSEPLNGLLKVE